MAQITSNFIHYREDKYPATFTKQFLSRNVGTVSQHSSDTADVCGRDFKAKRRAETAEGKSGTDLLGNFISCPASTYSGANPCSN